jgi:hypothetical protein
LVAAGSHYITNFDADSARHAARRANAAALRALLAVTLGQLLEARVRAQGSKIRAGIERREIVKARVECFLQRGKSFLFIAPSCIGRTEPVIVDADWAKTL